MSKFKSFPIWYSILLFFALIGLLWLRLKNLEAGETYLWIFLVLGVLGVAGVTLAKLVFKLDMWFEIPINKNNSRALVALVLGMVFLLFIVSISKFTGLDFYGPQVIAPLAQTKLGFGDNTFSAIAAAKNPFWTWFVGVFSASVIEETALGIGAVLIGVLLFGWGVRRIFGLDFGSDFGNRTYDFLAGIFFSIVLFTVLHSFNQSYVDANGAINFNAFAFAAMFRAIMNILIYKFATFGIMFGIGAHGMHNAIILGASTFFQAITTIPWGLFLIVIGLMMLFFAFTNTKEVIKESVFFKDEFLSFD